MGMESEFKNMLDFVDKLSEVNTKDIEPLIYLSDEINSLREDNISIKLVPSVSSINSFSWTNYARKLIVYVLSTNTASHRNE